MTSLPGYTPSEDKRCDIKDKVNKMLNELNYDEMVNLERLLDNFSFFDIMITTIKYELDKD